MRSQAQILADSMSPEELEDFYASFSDDEMEALDYDWSFWGRPEQQEPPGDWRIHLTLAGRGYGKTRLGAEWVRSCVCGPTPLAGGRYKRVALVAETAADARDVLVEGESGILSVHPKDFRPTYEPSKRRLTWPNGAIATLFNAVEPDQLRGPQADAAWCDELAKWRYIDETWSNLQFGLRLGSNPRALITTTPRPVPLLRELVKQYQANPNGPVHVTRGSTYDNIGNLAAPFIQQLREKYEGTRLGRQEIDAEILDDSPDALWRRAKIDEERVTGSGRTTYHKGQPFELPDMRRIVVAIDPAGVAGGKGNVPEGAETGIIVAGLGVDGRGYVLEDGSCGMDPGGWAKRAVFLFDKYDADVIVAETNQGGDMVEHTVRTERRTIPYKGVHAARGKATRAEPVAALYEQGRISHVGFFPKLEDQMVVTTPFGPEGGCTIDRVDALVWALTSLFPQIVHFTGGKEIKGEVKQDRWRAAFSRRSRDENWKTL